MGIVSNVISGVGSMWAAPLGSQVPIRTFEWPYGWECVGYTAGGITLEYTPNIYDLSVDQEIDPISQIMVSERSIIRTSLAEVTAENLCRVIAAKRNVTAEYIETLFGSGELPELMIGFEGYGPSGSGRSIYFPRAASRTSAEIDHKRDALETMRVEWLALTGGEIFEGTITPVVTSEGLLVTYSWTANGSDRIFNLPRKALTGSDPFLTINGVFQDALYGYTVLNYSGYTAFSLNFTPQQGDRIQAWYQIAAS